MLDSIDHVNIVVSDMERMAVRVFSDVQQVPEAQVNYAGGARKYLVYFQYPEGNLLELCEYRV